MKLKFEQNAAHDIAATEVQEYWRKNNARKHAMLEVQRLREERDAILTAKRKEELNRQSGYVKELAAITIQAFLRGTYTRQVFRGVRKKRVKKTYNVEDPEVIKAVTKIESHVRGTLIRNASKRELNNKNGELDDANNNNDDDIDNLGFQRNDNIFPNKKNDDLDLNNDLCTKFLNACSNGDLHSVHLMCRDQGVNIHCADLKGNSGVLCACQGGHLDVIRFLQSIGGSLLLSNFKGWSPLHRACFYGKEDVAEYIIETLARQGTSENPLALTNHLGATPLHVAIPNGHGHICEMLIRSGAPINVQNASGDSPLSFAVICRKPELVQLLVQSGADLNVRNKEGFTPYEVALNLNQNNIAEMLKPPSDNGELREDLARGVGGEHWADVNLSRHNKKSSKHQLLKQKQLNSTSSHLFGPLKVKDDIAKLKRSKNNNTGGGDGKNKLRSKALREDTKIIDLLLQNSSAAWSRRELVRRAWLASCPLCDEVKMKLQEIHTILHVLGVVPAPPQQAIGTIGTNSYVNIRLDKPQHTAADLITAAERLGVSKVDISTTHGATTRNKLLSLIRCPKGATVLIAERKKTRDWGEGTGKSLLQKLDLPESTINMMPCKGIDLMQIDEDSITTSPMLDVLPSIIKKRLLFHCEMLRTLSELESSKPSLNNNDKTTNFNKTMNNFSSTAKTTPASHNVQRAQRQVSSSSSISQSVNNDSYLGKDVVIDEREDGGWLTRKTAQVGADIQIAHFEELANNMSSSNMPLSNEELKIARRAASSRGKVVAVDNDDHVLVSLEDGLKTKLLFRVVYPIPSQVLTKPQLYVGANARVVKMGWLKQLLCDKNPNHTLSNDDHLIVDRFGGALVVVSKIDNLEHDDLVDVKAADGYEVSLPCNALTPPPIDAALRLLFRNSVTSVHSDDMSSVNLDSQHHHGQGQGGRSKASSSHASLNSPIKSSPTKKKNKHVINLRVPQASSSSSKQPVHQATSSSRPLYREVNDEEDDHNHKPYAHSMNRVPYVPDQMLRDGRVSDELGRGVKGNSTQTTQRPKTASAKIPTQKTTTNNTRQNHFQSNTFDMSQDFSSRFLRQSQERGSHTQRPKSASGLNGSRSTWEPVNVQSFDFTSAQPKKKEVSKEKPDMKFGIPGGVRKSLNSTMSHRSTKKFGSHLYQNPLHHHDEGSAGGGDAFPHHHTFTDDDFLSQTNSGVLFKGDPDVVPSSSSSMNYHQNSRNKKSKDSNKKMSCRPASAGAVRPMNRTKRPHSAGGARGITSSHEWSFGGSKDIGAGGLSETNRMNDTLRSTQTRQKPQYRPDDVEVDDDDIYVQSGGLNEDIDDADIRSHVEQLIDEHSGRWDTTGSHHIDQPTLEGNEDEEEEEDDDGTDEMFKTQLDRMELQMQQKEAQIKEAIERQKRKTKEMNLETEKLRKRSSSRGRGGGVTSSSSHDRKKSEVQHRKRRENLFRNDIAASVDELINNAKLTWKESDYEASELAHALDSLSEKLIKDKGTELEIRRKLKSLSKKQLKNETKLSEIHSKMGNIKMSRSDGIHRVLTLEKDLMELMNLHEKQGKDLKNQENKLNILKKSTEDVEALKTNEIACIDRDAKLIHSLELKSSLLRNRKKELLDSLTEVSRSLTNEFRKHEDHESQLTVVDVAIKAMKSVIGNYVATSN
jgi:ankyrin repeat protein